MSARCSLTLTTRLYQSDVEQAQAEVGFRAGARRIDRGRRAGGGGQCRTCRTKTSCNFALSFFRRSATGIGPKDFGNRRPAPSLNLTTIWPAPTYEAADAAVGVGVAAIAQANALQANSKAAVSKSRADLSIAQANLRTCTNESRLLHDQIAGRAA